MNVKTIDPGRVAGPETVTRVEAAPIANGDRKHPMLDA